MKHICTAFGRQRSSVGGGAGTFYSVLAKHDTSDTKIMSTANSRINDTDNSHLVINQPPLATRNNGNNIGSASSISQITKSITNIYCYPLISISDMVIYYLYHNDTYFSID